MKRAMSLTLLGLAAIALACANPFAPGDTLSGIWANTTSHGYGLQLSALAMPEVLRGRPPNMRLQLAGGDRSKGSGVLAPWRARTVVSLPCAGGRVARSLGASR